MSQDEPNSGAEASQQTRLLERMRAGDDTAFGEIVRTFGPRLLRVMRRFLPNEADAEEALQEAFLSAFRAIHSFAGESRLETWLHRIGVNAALMQLRRRRRRAPEVSIDDLIPQYEEDGHRKDVGSRWEESARAAIERKELRAIVRQHIDSLPDNYRNVLLLRDIEQLSTEEAASILGITRNAVKIRLHRARQALRTLLDPILQGAPT